MGEVWIFSLFLNITHIAIVSEFHAHQKNDLDTQLEVSKGFFFCLILVDVESIFTYSGYTFNLELALKVKDRLRGVISSAVPASLLHNFGYVQA